MEYPAAYPGIARCCCILEFNCCRAPKTNVKDLQGQEGGIIFDPPCVHMNHSYARIHCHIQNMTFIHISADDNFLKPHHIIYLE